MHSVEEKYNLKREFWLSFEGLKVLPPEVYSFMVIMEWLSYEDYEGYDYALSFNLDLVTKYLQQLGLTHLVNSLQQANNLMTLIFSKHGLQYYINATNELREQEEFQMCEADFKRQRPLIIERLYEFVKSKIAHYP